ncbi:hypothetical protein BVRB_5g124200 [Beta vulgaris subsp. vulgaris]|uniref:ARM repeat superfamily protein n=1 Tax=Beta vulgaris subsp. vulgaris TaxID=3555 RepID=A0A0J8B8X1_BETVV|nr:uncharacterized protein LOC104907982 [Beta vulgaris subsp. vulgaris]KMS97749.1 hypothetical protein BVRB_5g124200 [Beta vulgaris subsp. vulgaris]
MDHASPQAGDSSLHLQISDLKRLSDALSPHESATIFEPENSKRSADASAARRSVGPPVPAPEKKLTLFALRLAILEKAATGLGTLGFIWATVVLLGGFAITLDKTDFWVISIILLIESSRIFSRSHELEWQRQSTWTLTDAGITSFRLLKINSSKFWNVLMSMFRKPGPNGRNINASSEERQKKWDKKHLPTRRWASSDVPILPYFSWFFLSRNISKILQCLQILAAMACVALSLIKLIRRDFGEIAKGDSDKRNRKSALIIFYGLALAEASLFLLEKVYWELKVIYGKILEKVSEECEFGPWGITSVRRFFYDAYSRCVDGSVFDGLKMDMVSYSMELLASNSPDEQLMGARILRSFAASKRFSDDTLQKIGTTFSAVERLVEMLNWKDPEEEEIRQSAAEILSRLAGKKQNSLRVAGIPGSLESISSLLYVEKTSDSSVDEICQNNIVADHEHYGFWTFNHLGLSLLKKLARDHDNCGKIGNTRGLLPKIIEFTCAREKLLKDDNVATSQIKSVKKSLQVIKMLASTTGSTGKQLRKEISEIVFTFSNIRDILRHGEKHPNLQKLGIEILTSLAMEDDATERIGGTGGIIKELLNIFFREDMPSDQVHVRTAVGEALVMLALESKQNCHCILKLGGIEKLVKALEDPQVRIIAARILTNLCTYSAEDRFMELRGVAAAGPMVLKGIISDEDKLQEVTVGLAARAFKFITYAESSTMFEQAGIEESQIANVLVQILRKHIYPPAKFPRIRRFTIELAIWMMKDKESNVRIFKNLGLQNLLENVLETTSELESFNIFSGTVGLSRFKTSMHSLVGYAHNLLK